MPIFAYFHSIITSVRLLAVANIGVVHVGALATVEAGVRVT